MVGYSGTPLAQRLGFKPGHRAALRDAPPGFARTLGALPEGVAFVGAAAKRIDLALFFAVSQGALRKSFAREAARLTPAGMLWIAWPKQAAKVATDLTETVVREVGLAAGLVDVKVCAINETWSGLKFVRRLKDR
ncbi:MAG: DUF3052 domain-containing protein [Gemmatimonadales bacterium]